MPSIRKNAKQAGKKPFHTSTLHSSISLPTKAINHISQHEKKYKAMEDKLVHYLNSKRCISRASAKSEMVKWSVERHNVQYTHSMASMGI